MIPTSQDQEPVTFGVTFERLIDFGQMLILSSLRDPFIFRGDAASLLTIGSFQLMVELVCLQLCLGAFYLQLEFFRLHWESASNKHLNGL